MIKLILILILVLSGDAAKSPQRTESFPIQIENLEN